MPPRRTVLRATQNFRSGNNYTEARVTDVSESCMELWDTRHGIQGLKMVYEPESLRFFQARFEPLVPALVG